MPKPTATVEDWDWRQVWSWLSDQEYKNDLDQPSWRWTNGRVLIRLDAAGLGRLKVGRNLIDRLLFDIRELERKANS